MARSKEQSMRKVLLMSCLFSVVAAAQAPHPESPAKEAARQVMGVEQLRVEALQRSDTGALGAILDKNLTYVHASGRVDTKASLLEAIRSGQLHYISWKLMNIGVRMQQDTAILNGEYAVRVKDTRVQPGPFDVDVFFLAVYERSGGAWRQIAWESTRDAAKTPLK
jgi:hypothetical protein